MRALALLILLSVSSQSYAAPRFESAQAFPGETYEQARARHASERVNGQPQFFNQNILVNSDSTAYGYKQQFGQHIDVSTLPEWTLGAKKMEEAFQRVRDVQMYTDKYHPQFKRRSPWLYPVDGCYTRASHMARGLARMQYPKPGKVFVFGTWATLRAKTPYAPNGKAWWSFHTAAAYRLGNRAMVLDPSIDSTRILPLEEWVGLTAPDPSKVTVSICDGNAYAPSQTCRGGSEKQDYWAASQLEDYLDDEWSNLVNLGFDPVKLLGDNPPWKKSAQ